MALTDTPASGVTSLRAGQEVRAVFACTRKDRLTSRTGSPYLVLELRDRSGSVPARVFRDADVVGGRFARGDLVTLDFPSVDVRSPSFGRPW